MNCCRKLVDSPQHSAPSPPLGPLVSIPIYAPITLFYTSCNTHPARHINGPPLLWVDGSEVTLISNYVRAPDIEGANLDVHVTWVVRFEGSVQRGATCNRVNSLRIGNLCTNHNSDSANLLNDLYRD